MCFKEEFRETVELVQDFIDLHTELTECQQNTLALILGIMFQNCCCAQEAFKEATRLQRPGTAELLNLFELYCAIREMEMKIEDNKLDALAFHFAIHRIDKVDDDNAATCRSADEGGAYE